MLTRKEAAEELKAMLPHLEGVSIVGRTAYEMAIDALSAHVDEGDCISREAAVSQIFDRVWTKTDADGYVWVLRRDVIHTIDEIPAVDVVEVVLCKDCKHYHPYEYDGADGVCKLHTRLVTDEDFCSDAKSKPADSCGADMRGKNNAEVG